MAGETFAMVFVHLYWLLIGGNAYGKRRLYVFTPAFSQYPGNRSSGVNPIPPIVARAKCSANSHFTSWEPFELMPRPYCSAQRPLFYFKSIVYWADSILSAQPCCANRCQKITASSMRFIAPFIRSCQTIISHGSGSHHNPHLILVATSTFHKSVQLIACGCPGISFAFGCPAFFGNTGARQMNNRINALQRF